MFARRCLLSYRRWRGPWPVFCVYLGVTLPVRETAGEVTIIGIAYEIIGDFRLHVVVP